MKGWVVSRSAREAGAWDTRGNPRKHYPIHRVFASSALPLTRVALRGRVPALVLTVPPAPFLSADTITFRIGFNRCVVGFLSLRTHPYSAGYLIPPHEPTALASSSQELHNEDYPFTLRDVRYS